VMAGTPVPERDKRPGYRDLDPVFVLRVEDSNGEAIWKYEQPTAKQILSPELVYLMNDILSDNAARVIAFGRGNKLHLDDRRAAAKTGSTNNWKDAWTIGFTPQICVGVWVGNSDGEEMKELPGSAGAAPIWHDVMAWYLKDKPVEWYQRPPGLRDVAVDPISGLLPTEYSDPAVSEMFIEGTEPTAYDNVHRAFRVNKETGKLATVYTPPELIEERVYQIFPPEAADWVRENDIPQPPTEYDDIYGPGPAVGDVAIISPNPYAYVQGTVAISGNAKGDNFQLYRLEYGEGLNPAAWTQVGGDHHEPVDNGPLEFWNVEGLEGLYTLQLTVVRNDQSFQQSAIQVTVDNVPPEVALINPEEDKVYAMEDDEWINIQAEATDNVSMDRVEFYVDNRLIGDTTVAPYSLRWTIAMSDIVPSPYAHKVETQVITNPDGTISTTAPITITHSTVDTETGRVTQVFSGGMSVMTDTGGYTETHQIHAVAYDAAGNETKSEQVRVEIIHKPPEEEKEEEGEGGEGEPTASWPQERFAAWAGARDPTERLPLPAGREPPRFQFLRQRL
jgi:membrane carboxypeptidase/penicillin-binding protein PbpC